MRKVHERIIGKYKIIDPSTLERDMTMLTDNPREAIWEANKNPYRTIVNICGEREIRKEDGKWRILGS